MKLILAYLISLYFLSIGCVEKKPPFEDLIKVPLEQLNKNLPVMTDSITRFERATLLPNKTILFESTLIYDDSSTLDVKSLVEAVRPVILEHAKKSPNYQILRDNDATMIFLYKDKQLKDLFYLTFDPDIYNQK